MATGNTTGSVYLDGLLTRSRRPDPVITRLRHRSGIRRGLRFRPRAAVSAHLRRPAWADQGEGHHPTPG